MRLHILKVRGKGRVSDLARDQCDKILEESIVTCVLQVLKLGGGTLLVSTGSGSFPNLTVVLYPYCVCSFPTG
jgi:hypothetical protein